MSQPPFQPLGPQPQPMPAPPIPQPPKRKRFGWLALILTAIIALFVGIAVGGTGGGGTTTTTASPAPTVTRTITETPGVNTAPTEKPQPTVTVTTTVKPKAQPKADTAAKLGEGTYEVGKDVKAGRYKTTVPADSSGCYWERTKDDSGSFDSIIANDNANAGAKVSVTIKNGEFFKNNGCGDWVRQ